MAVLIGLAANYVLTVNRDSDSLYMLNSRIQPRYTALSGIQYALFAMQDSDSELRWKTDGRIYSTELSGGKVYVQILPVSGKLNINQATPELLTLLFTYAGVDEEEAQEIAYNVKHWIDRNDESVNSSVTDDDYISQGLDAPAHRRFYAIEELSQVLGITPQMYQKIKRLITVYGSNRINGLVASDEMLKVLTLSDDEIATIHSAKDTYYNDNQPIPAEVQRLNEFLIFNSRDAYYRIQSHSVDKIGHNESFYSIVKSQRSKNGSYKEMERGILGSAEKIQFQQTINIYVEQTQKGIN